MTTARLLVCTDLDRTLLPNGPQPESPGARALFTRLVARNEVMLAYVSGRDAGRVRDAMAEYDLPNPDFVIADVGTTVLRVGDDGVWREDAEWAGEIGADWADRDGNALHGWLSGFAEMERQEPDRQARYKLSYYAPDTPGDLPERLRKRLDDGGVRARVIWSLDEARGVGLVDILPASASKYHAIRALVDRERVGLDETVFCGDSGNDMEVLASDVPAVLVANATREVTDEARRLSVAAGHERALYVATGGYHGMNGCYAAGMLEGIAHFHPVVREWLGDPAVSVASTKAAPK